MAQKKLRLKLENLEVESFTASHDGEPAREGGVKGYDYSWFLGNSAYCDTDMDCSGACFVATNVCGPC